MGRIKDIFITQVSIPLDEEGYIFTNSLAVVNGLDATLKATDWHFKDIYLWGCELWKQIVAAD